MEKFITKSRGQGNRFSRLGTGVSNKWSSIVTQLDSRAITGRGLHINVHQHFSYELHLVWNHSSSERYVERMFLMYADVVRFCTELKKGALEGMCTCVRGSSRSWRTKLKNVLYRPRYCRIGTGQCLCQRLNRGKNTRANPNVAFL